MPSSAALTGVIVAAIAEAPLFTPRMPRSGRPFSVRMTNLGPLGWVSDRRGYRYQAVHPETGLPWPAIPDATAGHMARSIRLGLDPEACLVNVYRDDARMGLHQDRDELDFAAPVFRYRLGDTALSASVARNAAAQRRRCGSAQATCWRWAAKAGFAFMASTAFMPAPRR